MPDRAIRHFSIEPSTLVERQQCTNRHTRVGRADGSERAYVALQHVAVTIATDRGEWEEARRTSREVRRPSSRGPPPLFPHIAEGRDKARNPAREVSPGIGETLREVRHTSPLCVTFSDMARGPADSMSLKVERTIATGRLEGRQTSRRLVRLQMLIGTERSLLWSRFSSSRVTQRPAEK
jgi:hypothetical protein